MICFIYSICYVIDYIAYNIFNLFTMYTKSKPFAIYFVMQ